MSYESPWDNETLERQEIEHWKSESARLKAEAEQWRQTCADRAEITKRDLAAAESRAAALARRVEQRDLLLHLFRDAARFIRCDEEREVLAREAEKMLGIATDAAPVQWPCGETGTHPAASLRAYLSAALSAPAAEGPRCTVCGDSGYVTTDPTEPNPECQSCDFWERKAVRAQDAEGPLLTNADPMFALGYQRGWVEGLAAMRARVGTIEHLIGSDAARVVKQHADLVASGAPAAAPEGATKGGA